MLTGKMWDKILTLLQPESFAKKFNEKKNLPVIFAPYFLFSQMGFCHRDIKPKYAQGFFFYLEHIVHDCQKT